MTNAEIVGDIERIFDRTCNAMLDAAERAVAELFALRRAALREYFTAAREMLDERIEPRRMN